MRSSHFFATCSDVCTLSQSTTTFESLLSISLALITQQRMHCLGQNVIVSFSFSTGTGDRGPSRVTGRNPGPIARLELSAMDATVQELLESEVAPSTVSAYRSGVRRYNSFCIGTGLTAFPLTETVVCRFVAHLHQSQLSLSSIRLYLSAIRFFQIAYGIGNPHLESFDRLHYVVRGVARTQPRSGRASKLPITVEILQHLLRAWSSHSSHYEAVMLWAACTLGFFAFLRVGEFIAGENNGCSVLMPADVRVDSRKKSFIPGHNPSW